MAASRQPDLTGGAERDPGWRRTLQTALITAGSLSALAAVYAAPLVYILLFGILDAEWSRDEVARVASPSGRVEAVLYEMNGGATTSFGYEVWVVNLGGSVSRSQVERHPIPAYLYGAVRSSRAYGVNLRWEDVGTLMVECLEVRDVVQNVSDVQVGDQIVKIVLRPGMEDPSAPAGGMLYNRERAARAGDPRSAPVLPAGG